MKLPFNVAGKKLHCSLELNNRPIVLSMSRGIYCLVNYS